MFVPKIVIDWITSLKTAAESNALVSLTAIQQLREENAALRAERDTLSTQLITSHVMADWLRMRVNALEFERTALMEKAYNIKLPAPEIIRNPTLDPAMDPKQALFEDLGDKLAREFGLPQYGDKN